MKKYLNSYCVQLLMIAFCLAHFFYFVSNYNNNYLEAMHNAHNYVLVCYLTMLLVSFLAVTVLVKFRKGYAVRTMFGFSLELASILYFTAFWIETYFCATVLAEDIFFMLKPVDILSVSAYKAMEFFTIAFFIVCLLSVFFSGKKSEHIK